MAGSMQQYTYALDKIGRKSRFSGYNILFVFKRRAGLLVCKLLKLNGCIKFPCLEHVHTPELCFCSFFLNKFYIFLSSHSPILISASCFLFPNCHSQFLEYGQFLGAMVCWLNHFFVVWVHLLQVTVHSAARHFICSVNRKVQQILFLNSVPITTYSQLFFACSLAVRIFIPWCRALS